VQIVASFSEGGTFMVRKTLFQLKTSAKVDGHLVTNRAKFGGKVSHTYCFCTHPFSNQWYGPAAIIAVSKRSSHWPIHTRLGAWLPFHSPLLPLAAKFRHFTWNCPRLFLERHVDTAAEAAAVYGYDFPSQDNVDILQLITENVGYLLH
jgi:hypothetical protein